MPTTSKQPKLYTDRDRAEILSREVAVPFTEDFAWPGTRRLIVFDAVSYSKWLEEVLPIVTTFPRSRKKREEGVAVGKYKFCLTTFNQFGIRCGGGIFSLLQPREQRNTLPIYQRTTPAYIAFDAAVTIPVLTGDRGTTWMSLTPNEILTQRGALRRAKGNVAIAGLGMGWMARRILDRPQVNKLTVVEKEEAVVEYFGDALRKQYGDRVQFVIADAYTHGWEQHDVAIWDIWPGYGDAQFDMRFQQIKDQLLHGKKVCIGWGDKIHKE